ncbi:MAG: sigma 54-interacting transcriptional regulator [Gemmatimonadetes bacterium]|nr:sigma 54-interacting transcriptional regulator [Gemmatimonadota bacterium]
MSHPHEKPDAGTTGGASARANDRLPTDERPADDVGLLEQLAEFSRGAGEFGSALEYYEQILKIALKARESGELVQHVWVQMASCRIQTGDFQGALALLDRALATPGEARSVALGRIHNERAWALTNLGRYTEAEKAFRDARDTVLDREKAAVLARAQNGLGTVAMRNGDWETASRAFQSALSGFRTIEDRDGVMRVLNNLGLMEKNRGNYEQAMVHTRHSLRVAEELGDSYSAAISLGNLGVVEFKAGDWCSAYESWSRALRMAEAIGDKAGTVVASLGLGNYHLHRRELDDAAAFYERAEVLSRELSEMRSLALTHEFRGDLALVRESYEDARQCYLTALELGEKIAPRGDVVLEALRRLANLESQLGQVAAARSYLSRAIVVASGMHDDYELGLLLRVRARIESSDGDVASARDSYLESVRLLESGGTVFDLAVSRAEFAAFCLENIVDLEEAARHLELARETFERVGAEYEAGHAYLLAAKLEMVCDHPTGEARHHLQSAMALLERVGSEEDQAALASMHRDIDRLLEETAASERNDLAALNETVSRIQRESDPRAKVRLIERALEERMNADRVCLMLTQGDSIVVSPDSGVNRAEADRAAEIVDALRGDHALEAKPIVSTSPMRDPRFASDADLVHGLGSVAFMPLFSEDEVVGGLYVDVCQEAGYFRQPELDFLVAFAPAAGLAVQEMRLDAVRDENRELRRRLARRSGFEGIITQSRRMLEILDLIERLGDSQATVLLQGETGTGKELLAHALQRSSGRASGSFVVVNCAALSQDVLESELFGHVKGAFTDAKADKIGLFEKADGGTIFLDEIDKTPVAFQERLLRVCDQGEVKPVGSAHVRHVNVRIICATNRSLLDLVEEGRFLKDLYYRLRVIQIEIPPLRERKEDIPLLVDYFLEHFNQTMGRSVRGFSHEAMNALVSHSWPGNVRDLRHEVERAVAMASGETMIRREDLATHVSANETSSMPVELAADQSLSDLVETIEKELVERALRETGGNRSHAARSLGISRRGLLNKIARYEIEL